MSRKFQDTWRLIKQEKEIAIAIFAAIVLSGITVGLFIQKKSIKETTASNNLQINTTVQPVDGSLPPVNGQDVAEKGKQLQWVKSVHSTNAEESVDGTIIEKIDPNQNFAGDLHLPKGWTVQYSCDNGVTYFDTPTCNIADVTYLKITTGTAQTLKPFTQSPITQPVEARPLGNSPFKTLPPVLYGNQVFEIMQAVNVQDAGSGSDFTINCFDLTTYAQCTDAPFPTYLSSQAGTALGQGPKDINTPMNMQTYIDDGTYGNKGHLYIPAQSGVSGTSYGVDCIDLIRHENCGFTSLGTSGTTYPAATNPVLVSGFVESGGKLYGHANDADQANQTVVCFDLNSDGQGTDAPCAGFTSTTTALTPIYKIEDHGGAYRTTGNHVMAGDKMFWIVNYSAFDIWATANKPCVWNSYYNFYECPDMTYDQRGWGTVITCYNVKLKQACSGWPNSYGGKQFFNSGPAFYVGRERPGTLFAWKNNDASNTPKAICLITGLASSIDPGLGCYDISNGALDTGPGNPGGMFPSAWPPLVVLWTGGTNPTEITDSEGTKTYIPLYNTATNELDSAPAKGATTCWNWTTQSTCGNFPVPRFWHDINRGKSGDTGYFYDGSCMWGVGYGDYIWSFDAKTGETPCRVSHSKYTATLTPNDFYCDGKSHVFSWGKVRLAKASMYDFDRFDITIKNKAGDTVLSQTDLKQDSDLDLSSIDYNNPNNNNKELSVEVVATVFNTSPWARGNLPYVNLVSNSDDAQYCYKTTAKTYCDVDALTTQSDASIVTDIDTLTSDKTTKIPLDQPANEQCFKDLSVKVTSDKTQISPGDSITYSLQVTNRANENNFNRGIVTGASYQLTFPSSLTYVSSSVGGQVSGNKVTWPNQGLDPTGIAQKTVTLKANSSVSLLDHIKSDKVAAATTQTPLTVQAAAVYGEDYNQADNTAQDASVVLVTVTNDNTGGGTDTGGGTTDTTPGIPTDAPTSNFDPTTGSPSSAPTSSASSEPLTPSFIRNVLPPSLANQTESFFKIVNAAVTPIPNQVATAVPYATIAFLIAFATIYLYQGIQERNARKQMINAYRRFKRTEELRRNYIDLTSHYLNTPIATMGGTLDLMLKMKQLPKTTADAAHIRLQHLVTHIQAALSQSQGTDKEAKKAAAIIEPVLKKKSFFTPGVLLPIFGVLLVTVIVNATFVWADKYDSTRFVVAIQSSYYILSAVALLIAYNIFRNQRYAASVAEHELSLEKELANSQTGFIKSSSKTLEEDIIELDQLSPAIVTLESGRPFGDGLDDLKDSINKITYLNSLTTKAIIPTIPNQTIKDLVNEAIDELRPVAESRQVKLNVSVESGLTVLVDIDGLKQILSSTINNGIKFNKAGGTVDVNVKRHKKDSVVVTVKDTGTGIPKDKINRLFEPFGRATDSRKFNYEGFGLDLYMDKLIAEQCGGSIRIDSKEGQGTTVTIILPT